MNTQTITAYERRHRRAIADLLFYSKYTHHHLDWHEPEVWLNTDSALARLVWQDDDLIGLIASHVPLNGASWVRLAALEPLPQYVDTFHLAWTAMRDELRAQGAVMACWLVAESWLEDHLPALGFAYYDEVVTLRRSGAELPPRPRPVGLALRPAESDDAAMMAVIDQAAFAPPWQNSHEDVRQARRQASLSTVALLDGQIVGYQMTTVYQQSGHLARLAVLPQMHGRGVGGALISDTITQLLRRRVRTMTVNTQLTNTQSLGLYAHFDFQRTGYDMPIWACHL